MTARAKDRKAQRKRARASSFAIVDKPQVAGGANLHPPGVFLVCRCFCFFSGVTFVLFRFRLFAFTEPAALRLIVL